MAAIETGRHKWPGMRLNRAHPLAQHLYGCWMMNDEKPQTVVRDLSGRSNHGTFINSPSWVDGPLGVELDYRGPSAGADNISIDVLAENGAMPVGQNELSVEAWIRFDGPTSAVEFTWFGHWNGTTTIICRYDSTSNRIEFWINTSGGASQFNTTVDIDDGNYHHVVCTYSNIASLMRVYVDGLFQQSTAKTGTIASGTGTVFIGAWGSGNDLWDGKISFVRLYNREIGPWVSRLYAFPFEMFE